VAKKTKKESKGKYTAARIKVLEGLEGVRLRPAMYIGSTGKEGLHHLVFEVVDNGVDEAMEGYCKNIIVSLNKDGSVTVRDDGRGIPVGIHPVYKKPALEVVVTKLHAGGKFDKKSYQISGGLHGVGISVVAALSTLMRVTVWRDGNVYEQDFSKGKVKTKLKIKGKSEKNQTGTEVAFYPDPEIFSTTTEFDYRLLRDRLQEIAFLNKGLKIIVKEEATGKKDILHYEGGIVEFVKFENKNKEVLHKPIYFIKEEGHVVVESSIQYNTGYHENVLGFVNSVNTIEGGTHVVGFKTAVTRAINDYAKRNNMLKNSGLTGDDVREGLTAVISLKIPQPQFEGQTKTKLGNSEVKGIVDRITHAALNEFFEETPSVARKIAGKAIDAQKARHAAKKAKELVRRKSAFGGGSLPGKLADCSKKNAEDTELFIVEGDSAGGSAKQGRNRENQAVLPLKGKILNVEKANPVKVFSSEEISNLITAIGTGIGENFNIEKLRYSKIIIMTDADVDGAHIRTLLLTFFYRYMKRVIEDGHLYIAVSPLFRVRRRGVDRYVYSDAELKKVLKTVGPYANIQRFKGLGEMNPEQLWDTTMDPKKRMLNRVIIKYVVRADETFSKLMGSEVGPRREFIEEKAKEARVDI